MYKNKPHVVERVYRAIMSKKADRWMRSTAVRRSTSKHTCWQNRKNMLYYS
jgi:hypothetical protein